MLGMYTRGQLSTFSPFVLSCILQRCDTDNFIGAGCLTFKCLCIASCSGQVPLEGFFFFPQDCMLLGKKLLPHPLWIPLIPSFRIVKLSSSSTLSLLPLPTLSAHNLLFGVFGCPSRTKAKKRKKKKKEKERENRALYSFHYS